MKALLALIGVALWVRRGTAKASPGGPVAGQLYPVGTDFRFDYPDGHVVHWAVVEARAGETAIEVQVRRDEGDILFNRFIAEGLLTTILGNIAAGLRGETVLVVVLKPDGTRFQVLPAGTFVTV